MNKFSVITVLFAVFISFQLAGSVVAVHIDHGVVIGDHGLKKVDYITQIDSPNHVKIFTAIYVRDNIRQPWDLQLKRTITLTKADKDTLTITTSNPSLIRLAFTDLNAVQYYWLHKYELLQ